MLKQLIIVTVATLGVSLWGQTNVYDVEGRLIRVIHAAGKATLYEYDSADNLKSVQNVDVPSAADGLQVERGTETSALLTWTDNADSETGYRIERRSALGYNWTELAVVASDAESYLDETLNVGITYVYRILALGVDDLTSSYTAEVTAAGEYSLPFNLKQLRYVSDSVIYPLEVQFESEDTVVYRLETSETLAEGSWVEASFALAPSATETQTQVSGTGLPIVIYLSIPTDPVFYRLLKEEELE